MKTGDICSNINELITYKHIGNNNFIKLINGKSIDWYKNKAGKINTTELFTLKRNQNYETELKNYFEQQITNDLDMKLELKLEGEDLNKHVEYFINGLKEHYNLKLIKNNQYIYVLTTKNSFDNTIKNLYINHPNKLITRNFPIVHQINGNNQYISKFRYAILSDNTFNHYFEAILHDYKELTVSTVQPILNDLIKYEHEILFQIKMHYNNFIDVNIPDIYCLKFTIIT